MGGTKSMLLTCIGMVWTVINLEVVVVVIVIIVVFVFVVVAHVP
jgi:hypothetical protein